MDGFRNVDGSISGAEGMDVQARRVPSARREKYFLAFVNRKVFVFSAALRI
jgi:hypothetical protein